MFWGVNILFSPANKGGILLQRDVSWNVFFEDDTRFADFINACGCNGEVTILPEDLLEEDTKNVFSQGVDGVSNTTYRDMIRKVARGINFIIVGIEHQETVNYGMPLTIMGYELGSYKKQKRDITRKNRQNQKNLKEGEFLYGLRKEDKLYPVVTFVLYTGEDWDGATNLKGILDFNNIPEKLQKLVQDYSIHLINIREWKDTNVFQTDLKQVFDFIRYSENKDMLKALVEKDENFSNLREDTYDVIEKYGKVKGLNKEKYKGKDGKIDMCKAMDDWAKEEREIGLREGHDSGIQFVVENMIKEGVEDEDIIRFTKCSRELLEKVRIL